MRLTTTHKYAGMFLGLVSAGVLQAQESSSPSAIEEIVVTASKRGNQLIQDIPITVQAISGQRLEEIARRERLWQSCRTLLAEETRNSLALAMKSGRLRVLDDGMLFDRALEAVIGNLRQGRPAN